MIIIGNKKQIKDMVAILAETEVACVVNSSCAHYNDDCRKCIRDNIKFIEIGKQYTDTDIEYTNKVIRDYIKTTLNAIYGK